MESNEKNQIVRLCQSNVLYNQELAFNLVLSQQAWDILVLVLQLLSDNGLLFDADYIWKIMNAISKDSNISEEDKEVLGETVLRHWQQTNTTFEFQNGMLPLSIFKDCNLFVEDILSDAQNIMQNIVASGYYFFVSLNDYRTKIIFEKEPLKLYVKGSGSNSDVILYGDKHTTESIDATIFRIETIISDSFKSNETIQSIEKNYQKIKKILNDFYNLLIKYFDMGYVYLNSESIRFNQAFLVYDGIKGKHEESNYTEYILKLNQMYSMNELKVKKLCNECLSDLVLVCKEKIE